MKPRLPFRLLAAAALLLATLAAAQPTPPPTATQPGDTLLILDASGSMEERIRGEPKIVIARRAVRELVSRLPAGTRLGLVAYSHRRNRCDDIELLIPPGPLDPAQFIQAVDALEPRGRTPVAASLEFAAQALNSTRHPANLILVSDGEETCGGDPCATARELAARSVGLKIHAVAFDLTARQARAFACVAAATGGRFLQANDAGSLQDALVTAVAEAATPKPTLPPSEDLTPATLVVPSAVAAGADFAVTWKGPDNPGDYLCIVPAGAPDDAYENTGYTRQGTPLTLTALLQPGKAEVRYVAGRSRKILGRAPLAITPVTIAIEAVDESVAGSPLTLAWRGPNHRGDHLTIVPKDAPDTAGGRYLDVARGTPLQATTPIQPGEAEIRYLSGQGRQVLARRSLRIVPAKVTLDGPETVVAGSPVEIAWTGPNHADDFLVIVPKANADTAWRSPVATRHGAPAKLTAPIEPGEAEIRYYSGEGHQVLARRNLTVIAAEVTLDAPAEAIAGSTLAIAWTGPNHDNDFVAIVPKSAADGAWRHPVATRQGSPLQVTVPIEAGEAEIRYLSGIGHRVLARRPLRIVAAEIQLDAPAEALAGSVVDVRWSGPHHRDDFLVITPRTAPDGAWKRTTYARGGSPARVTAPIEPGEAEVRYLSGVGHKVLARRPITIQAASISLEAPAQAIAGGPVTVTWTGPNLDNDFLVIVPRTAADGAWKRTTYSRNGSPATVIAPLEPGEAEIRYLSGEGYKVLARRPIEVVAATITLSAPTEAVAASEVTVEWTGPNHANDFLAIVPQAAADGSWGRTAYTRQGSPLKLPAPSAPGAAEIRYYSGLEHRVLARRPLRLKAPEITLTPPASAPAGSIVSLVWTGPNHPNDYLTIVPQGTKDGVNGKLAYARQGSPAKLPAPAAVGPAEVRYVNGSDHRVLARAPLLVTAP